MKTKFATRAFNDAGTGRAFAAGEEISDVEDGVLENYEAAGLVSDDGEPLSADADGAATVADTDSVPDAPPPKRKASTRRRKPADA